MVYAFYVMHEWGGLEGNLGYIGLDNFRELKTDEQFWTWPAGTRDGALEHLLLRAPRRPAADDARADDGADRQRAHPRPDVLPLGVLLPRAHVLCGDLDHRHLSAERRRARTPASAR